MVQMAYRTKYCGWTLEEATDEIARTFGLIEVAHGPDYRHVDGSTENASCPIAPPEPTATAARHDAHVRCAFLSDHWGARLSAQRQWPQ